MKFINGAERRAWSVKNVRACPACGTEQIQIISYFTDVFQYKCRKCKHKFEVAYDNP